MANIAEDEPVQEAVEDALRKQTPQQLADRIKQRKAEHEAQRATQQQNATQLLDDAVSSLDPMKRTSSAVAATMLDAAEKDLLNVEAEAEETAEKKRARMKARLAERKKKAAESGNQEEIMGVQLVRPTPTIVNQP